MTIHIAPRITADPEIRFGRPVFEGTRVPVHTVLAKLGAGMSQEEVAAEYGIAIDDVKAGLAYAAAVPWHLTP